MVNALGGLPVANVVLAAGVTGNTNQAQLNYEIGIVANVRSMCPGARVVWPPAPPNDVWGACYCLPLQEEVGLLDDSPGGFVGTGNMLNGITIHNY